METGLLIGLVFPGGEVVFFAGMAASEAGAKILGEAKLSPLLLFTLAPVAAIVGGEVGYWFGKKYGRKFFERPDSRFFTNQFEFGSQNNAHRMRMQPNLAALQKVCKKNSRHGFDIYERCEYDVYSYRDCT